jgi:AraC-like DNA-binding protein
LKDFIQSIWFMNWEIPDGEELRSIVVPTPCIHLMGLFVPVVSVSPLWHAFLGVKKKGEVRFLKGHGQSFGVEFRPGGLFPFLNGPVREWENSLLPLRTAFPEAPFPPHYPLTTESFESWVVKIEAFFSGLLTSVQPHHLSEISLAMHIFMNEEVKHVEDILPSLPVSKRTLQRIFQNEVGLSARDALRVARFHRSIKAMNTHSSECLASFALESGFFDQPHMTNEFRKLVETKPAQFRKYW